MIARKTLEQVDDALTRARDVAVVLMYAAQGANENEEKLRDFVASADTVLEHLIDLISEGKSPVHDAIVDDNGRQLRDAAKGGGR